MPRGDKTGPAGQGPNTGRGRGGCSQRNGSQVKRGNGSGLGRGKGRGSSGQGRGNR